MLRTLQTGVALLALVLGTLLVAPSPASATAAECERGANGFVDIPDNLWGAQPSPASNYIINFVTGAQITLNYGTVAGAQRGWARIGGDTRPGDRVWLEWTWNGGANILQCGPFTVTQAATPKTSAAKNTSSSTAWRFRACGNIVGYASTCTAWW